MQKYSVPQFIEREAKIAYFLSFRQFIYLLAAGAACFVLYFILPFFLFIIVVIVLGGAAVILGFVKVEGTPILTILLNSIGFMGRAKNYTWKKKEAPYLLKKIEVIKIKKLEERPVLKPQMSQLKKTRTQVELRTK